MPSKENHSLFLRPNETWLATTEPVAPWSVSNIIMAPSSVPTGRSPSAVTRSAWAVDSRASNRVIR